MLQCEVPDLLQHQMLGGRGHTRKMEHIQGCSVKPSDLAPNLNILNICKGHNKVSVVLYSAKPFSGILTDEF